MTKLDDQRGETDGRVGSAPPSALSLWFTAPREIEFRPSAIRAPREGEVRIRARYSGISSGTEMLVYRGLVPAHIPLDRTIPTLEGSFGFPIKYGYASVGEVVEVGPGVAGIRAGDMVFAFNPHETEYTLSARFVIKLPAEVEPREGVFLANLETAVNALLDAAPRLGERLVIFGQGVVGLLITQLARRAGLDCVIACDPIEKRRALSLLFGADAALGPQDENTRARVLELTGGAGADLVIEASGHPVALDQAIKLAGVEGRIVVVSWYGLKPVSLALGDEFHRNRITIKSSQVSRLDPSLGPLWTYERRQGVARSYLGKLRLREMISDVIPFKDAIRAYRLVDERPEDIIQVVLDFGG
ncbi:MAG TPA: zinc-binding dehydrogenase [Blastocatellia bacterium]|nr:zinc-binding dehydrogenase [Blastocatellia bacterium]